MKKILSIVLVVVAILALAAGCGSKFDPAKKSEGVLTYAQYAAAELETAVVIEAYVQAKQSWWNDQAVLYLQDPDGAYFAYNATVSQEDYNKLVVGTKVKVSGTKTAWSGEVELNTGATVEILTDGTWVATPIDLTSKLASDDLINYQNQFFPVKGAKVVAKDDGVSPFYYGWDNSGVDTADADLYFDVEVNGATYSFVIEYYLCNENSDAYKAVQALHVGDIITVEGFLYWYNGANPHITKVTVTG